MFVGRVGLRPDPTVLLGTLLDLGRPSESGRREKGVKREAEWAKKEGERKKRKVKSNKGMNG